MTQTFRRLSLSWILVCMGMGSLPLQADHHLPLVWSDEFEYTGLPDDTKWGYDVGGHGWGNQESQYYTENRLMNARVENGVLVIEAHKESFEGSAYTSARVISKGKGDWKYGRFEIRAKLPQGRGTWPAIWMLPTDWIYGGWPASGEIDIMEHVGYDMNRIHGTIHTEAFNHTKGTQIGSSILAENVDTEFHVYAMEWRPDRIDIFMDGERYFTFFNQESSFASWPFDQRFHLLLNIAVGGSWGGVQGIDDSIFPQRMEVDYVRVYAFEEFAAIQPQHVPSRVEAENFSNQSGIRLEPTTDMGGGVNAGYLADGDWAEYLLQVNAPGHYAFDLRYASLNGTAGVTLSSGFGLKASSGPLIATGGWQSWRTQRIAEADLDSGETTLRLSINAPIQEDLNYNWLDVVLLEADTLSEPFADPDQDGLANVFEHAFALNYLQADSENPMPFAQAIKTEEGTFIQITYRQRIGGTGTTGVDYSVAGLSYRVETSRDLQNGSWEYGPSLFRQVGSPINNGDGSETVTVQFAFPLNTERRFLRLNLLTMD